MTLEQVLDLQFWFALGGVFIAILLGPIDAEWFLIGSICCFFRGGTIWYLLK